MVVDQVCYCDTVTRHVSTAGENDALAEGENAGHTIRTRSTILAAPGLEYLARSCRDLLETYGVKAGKNWVCFF